MNTDSNATICNYLLSKLTSTVPLQILPSSIPGAGTGLFTKHALDEGEEIFRSDPLISCVSNETQDTVCDYCFANSNSQVLSSGRFRQTPADIAPPPKTCSSCKTCYYCSKDCQKKAWRRYHKHECGTLNEHRGMHPRTRALFRLLNMQKAELIDAQQWDAVSRLESHLSKHLRSPNSTWITETSIAATLAKDTTNLRMSEVMKTYGSLLTNCMCIISAEGETLGTTLDLVASFMNHSCDPTALVFFEGRQMRVRTLRPLRPGEEITQTYVDLEGAVFTRQATTEADYFFRCTCARCQEELKELREKCNNDDGWMETLDRSQKRLLQLLNNAIGHFNRTYQHLELKELEVSAKEIICESFPNGDWPDHIPPMHLVHGFFAKICKANNNYSGALRHALRSLIGLKRRVGKDWVHSLFDMMQILSSVVILPSQHPMFKENRLVSQDDCWNVFHGYLGELNQTATKTFGPDFAYTKSITNWYSEAICSASQPRPGTREFRVIYETSQLKLLKWAGIEESRGIDLPAERHV